LKTIKDQIDAKSANPRDLKRRLAQEIVTLYYDSAAANQAEENFDRVFVRKEAPEEVEEITLASREPLLFQLLVNIGAAKSNGEARRLVVQGGVAIDGTKITDPNTPMRFDTPFILKVGKRKFYRIRK
jgi:tyrosyl-tRNA synthetase